MTGRSQPAPSGPDGGRVPFVEPKAPSWDRLRAICAASEAESRWANFGPVSERLGQSLHAIMRLPASRAVVAASSATTALQAILGAHAVRRGRPLTWAASAFGFYSTAIGPLDAQVRLVDSDRAGMADIDALARLAPDAWDGLIVTNIFGIAADLAPYAALCQRQGKPMIVDAALGFPLPRFHHLPADEIVSFHHTKPWGFGEGGCAIVAEADASAVRSFLNFGVGEDVAFRGLAMNGKISDLAAAAILDRLETLPAWAAAYARERERISALVAQAGFPLLGEAPREAIVAHLPVLLPRPVPLADLPAARFDVGRYYRPLRPGFPVAGDLYERMVNIPAHAAMAAIGSDEIADYLARLKQL